MRRSLPRGVIPIGALGSYSNWAESDFQGANPSKGRKKEKVETAEPPMAADGK